jgi:hypothetical protein
MVEAEAGRVAAKPLAATTAQNETRQHPASNGQRLECGRMSLPSSRPNERETSAEQQERGGFGHGGQLAADAPLAS